MITQDLRRSRTDLPAELTGSMHVFKRLNSDQRKPLTITIDESKLSRAGADVESRRAGLIELQAKKEALEATREPLREEFQRLATLNALGEASSADVGKVRTQLADIERELQSLSDTDSELCGQIELAGAVLRELQNRKDAAIEQERARTLKAQSEVIRANLATLLSLAKQADAVLTDTVVKLDAIAGAGLAKTYVGEFPNIENVIHAFFHRYELYLPPEEG